MQKTICCRAGDGGYSAYRIPSCIALPSGRVLLFCEGRCDSLADTGRIRILCRVSQNGGYTFSSWKVIAENGMDTVGNPCPVYDRDSGRLFLLLNANKANGGEALILKGHAPRSVLVTSSDDEGDTWTPLKDISSMVKPAHWTWHATGPCHGAQLASGRLLIPCNHAELLPELEASGPYISGTIYSDDHGETWHYSDDIGPDTNECSLAPLADGRVYMNMRSYAGKHRRSVSVSQDGGLHWSKPQLDDALVEPVCQGSVLSVKDKLFFCNPASEKRERMTLRRSDDGGKTWSVSLCLHEGPAAYSDIACLPDGKLLVLFESGETSAYERLELAWISPKDMC